MLDINTIRDNKEIIADIIKNRQRKPVDLDQLISLDDKRKELIDQINQLRQKRNELDDKIKFATDNTERQKYIAETTDLKPQVQTLEQELKEVEQQQYDIQILVPNLIHPDVHVGIDDSENKVLRQVGTPKNFDFEVKDHMQLGLQHNLIDTDTSAKISGARFNYLFGDAVRLQFALIQYTMDVLSDRTIIAELAKKVGNPFDTPFIPAIVPVMAKSEIMKKMDRFDPIDDRYYFEKDDVLLIGSAEHTLGPIHMDTTFEEETLPIRYIGYSTAFRREAGAYGKDTVGILRRHQFDKLEMESFIQPQYGEVEQDLIVAIQEYLVSSLDLPYQVIGICTGDMGKPDYRQVDIETYIPSQGKYRETHTSDYMTDYQARRLNIKYRNKDTNEKEYVHMNDATAFAIGRILIAILENNQQADGSIVVPEVLQKYVGKNLIK